MSRCYFNGQVFDCKGLYRRLGSLILFVSNILTGWREFNLFFPVGVDRVSSSRLIITIFHLMPIFFTK